MSFDIREALAADLVRMGLMADADERTVDMGTNQAREVVWGAYGLSAPTVDEDES